MQKPFKIGVILIVLLISAAFIYWDTASTPSGTAISAHNKTNPMKEITAPDVKFRNLNGDVYSLSQFKNKAIVLNFWATWCTPCLVEFPQLVQLAKSLKKEIVVITLSVDKNSDDIREYIKNQGFDLPKNFIVGLDKDKSISQDMFQTFTYPESYIISHDLKIKSKIIGLIDWQDKGIKNYLRDLSL